MSDRETKREIARARNKEEKRELEKELKDENISRGQAVHGKRFFSSKNAARLLLFCLSRR